MSEVKFALPDDYAPLINDLMRAIDRYAADFWNGNAGSPRIPVQNAVIRLCQHAQQKIASLEFHVSEVKGYKVMHEGRANDAELELGKVRTQLAAAQKLLKACNALAANACKTKSRDLDDWFEDMHVIVDATDGIDATRTEKSCQTT